MPKPRSKLLVVGCGHSATEYIAKVFQQIGLDVPHEYYVGRDGIVRWSYTHLRKAEITHPHFKGEADNAKFALPIDAIILHQVRNPSKVIASVTTMNDSIWEYVGYRAGLRGIDWNPLDDEHPLRGMKYWLLWNQFAEELACYTYKVEALPGLWPKILSILGLSYIPLPDVRKNTGAHNCSVTYSWDDLYRADGVLANCITYLGRHYGYDM